MKARKQSDGVGRLDKIIAAVESIHAAALAVKNWDTALRAAETLSDLLLKRGQLLAAVDQEKALRTFDGELGDGGVLVGGPVEGRGHDLALHRPPSTSRMRSPMIG